MGFAPLSMTGGFYHCDPQLQIHLWQVGEAPLESFGELFNAQMLLCLSHINPKSHSKTEEGLALSTNISQVIP